MKVCRLVVLAAMAAPSGCDYIAQPERLVDPDVISIAMVLVAGQRQAHLLAGHPYLHPSDPPPEVTAVLTGPRWRVALTHKTDPMDGCGGGPTNWPIPMVCLSATLPDPIQERVTYKLEGRGPKGTFSGEATVPAPPHIWNLGDTVWLPESTSLVRIPIRYRVPPELGTVRPEVFQTVRKGNGTESKWIPVSPVELELDGEDTIVWAYSPDFQWASLNLLGIGWRYTHFWRSHGKRMRWPRVGLSGEGVYGYFDGSAKSPRVHVVIEDGG